MRGQPLGQNCPASSQKGGVKTYEFYSFNGSLLMEFTPALFNRRSEHIHLGGRRIASVGPAPTALTLPASTFSLLSGQSLTLVATVGGGVSPTGTVSFFDGATALGNVNLSGAQATLTTTLQGVGAHAIRATYSGDGQNLGSSATATANLLSPSTITSPAAGQGYTVTAGKTATLSATVGGYSPTGTVSFYVGSTLLGTAVLSGGTGSISTTLPTPGDYTVTIVYSGDANNAPSSATTTLTVTLPPEQLIPILQLLLED